MKFGTTTQQGQMITSALHQRGCWWLPRTQIFATPAAAMCVVSSVALLGSRHGRADDDLEPQRPVDADGRPQRICQVLAEQHEQREDVPGAQRPRSRSEVGYIVHRRRFL